MLFPIWTFYTLGLESYFRRIRSVGRQLATFAVDSNSSGMKAFIVAHLSAHLCRIRSVGRQLVAFAIDSN